uniref:Variant surface glycoprotein 1125.2576 n=1 Tax=Trypanosoma brucei TaxID=5691 RepID=A0A1J0R8A2_9TRYP|nr:variant surface glycoprotein 1125.2576 [Trypanosoma brucei]
MLTLVVASTLIINHNSRIAAAAAQGAVHLTALTELCKTAKAGKTVAALLTNRITKLTGWEAEYSLFCQKIATVQVMEAQPSMQLATLKEFANTTLSAIESELKELAEAAPSAVAKTAYAAGLIADFVAIFTSTGDTTGINNVCIINGGSDETKVGDSDLGYCFAQAVRAKTTNDELKTLAKPRFNFGDKAGLTAPKSCPPTKADGTTYSGGTAGELKPAKWGSGVLTSTYGGSDVTLTSTKRGLPAHEAARSAAATIKTKIKNTECKPVTSTEDMRALLMADPADETMLTAIKIATNKLKDIGYTPTITDVERIFGFNGKHENVPFIKILDQYKVTIQEDSKTEQTKQTEVMKLTETKFQKAKKKQLAKTSNPSPKRRLIKSARAQTRKQQRIFAIRSRMQLNATTSLSAVITKVQLRVTKSANLMKKSY